MAENEDILRKVAITNLKRSSSPLLPPVACLGLGSYEQEAPAHLCKALAFPPGGTKEREYGFSSMGPPITIHGGARPLRFSYLVHPEIPGSTLVCEWAVPMFSKIKLTKNHLPPPLPATCPQGNKMPGTIFLKFGTDSHHLLRLFLFINSNKNKCEDHAYPLEEDDSSCKMQNTIKIAGGLFLSLPSGLL